MLVPAPYKAPKKEAHKEAKETRGGLRRRGALDKKSEDSNTPLSKEEEEEEDESPTGGGKKRMASTSLEAEFPKREKTPLSEAGTTATESSPEWDPRAQPLENSEVHKIRTRLCFPDYQGRNRLIGAILFAARPGLVPNSPHRRIRWA